MGLMATGGERLGIYLNGLKISGSAQCLYKDRVVYHCTLLYDTDLTALHQALNPEPMVDDETLSSVYAVPVSYTHLPNVKSICPLLRLFRDWVAREVLKCNWKLVEKPLSIIW